MKLHLLLLGWAHLKMINFNNRLIPYIVFTTESLVKMASQKNMQEHDWNPQNMKVWKVDSKVIWMFF